MSCAFCTLDPAAIDSLFRASFTDDVLCQNSGDVRRLFAAACDEGSLRALHSEHRLPIPLPEYLRLVTRTKAAVLLLCMSELDTDAHPFRDAVLEGGPSPPLACPVHHRLREALRQPTMVRAATHEIRAGLFDLAVGAEKADAILKAAAA